MGRKYPLVWGLGECWPKMILSPILTANFSPFCPEKYPQSKSGSTSTPRTPLNYVYAYK